MNYPRLTPVFPEGKIRALTFSYDDGSVDDRKLVEIFNRYGMKGTFHLNSGNFDREGRVSTAEIPELYKGHEISCHSLTHPFLERLPAAGQMMELMEDRKNLEKVAGYPVVGMSYPFGTSSPELIVRLRSLGMVYSRTTVSTHAFGLPADFMLWHPTCHHTEPELTALGDKFLKSNYPMNVFYVWGHSFEFNETHNNNWELMENFCKKMANDAKTWYASNLEIFRYAEAWRRVIQSCDGSILENPSARPLWFEFHGEIKQINGGESIRLSY